MCGDAPAAPVLPQYPDLTPAEQTNIGQQTTASNQGASMINTVSGQLGNNTSLLQGISGLFNSDGSINQTALAALSQQTQQTLQGAGTTGNAAMTSAGSQYAPDGAMAQTQTAYTNALKGGAPANQQIAFQQKQSFQQMQQQAAQQGIKITGSSFDNAVSSSTAGQRLIQNFQQNANIQNQNYNLGYVGQLAGNMGQLSGAAATTASTGQALGQYATQTPLNTAQASVTNGQAALAPLLASYQNQLSSAYQPLYMQQVGPYQQQMAQAQANYQAGENEFNNRQNQLAMLTPSVSFMGFGANPHAGGGASTSVGSSGGGGSDSSGEADV